jgi:hypothetical protein
MNGKTQEGINVLAWKRFADAAPEYRSCSVPLPVAAPDGDPQYGLLLQLVALLPIELDGRGLKIVQVVGQESEVRKADRLLKACVELLACASDLPRTRAADDCKARSRT